MTTVYMYLPEPSPAAFRRTVAPCRALNGYDDCDVHLAATYEAIGESNADVVVLPAPFDRAGFNLVRKLKDRGTRVIVDVHMWHETPPYDPRYFALDRTRPFSELVVSMADALTVASESLSEGLKELNSVRHVMRGWLEGTGTTPGADTRAEVRSAHGVPDGAVVLACNGGPLEEHSLRVAARAIERIACSDLNVWVLSYGALPEYMFVPEERLIVCETPQYSQQLRLMLLADIAVLPLEATLFNERESLTRILDAGYAGVPLLCSPVGPALEAQSLGVPITMCGGEDEWQTAIEALISSAETRRRSGAEVRSCLERALDAREAAEAWHQLVVGLSAGAPL